MPQEDQHVLTNEITAARGTLEPKSSNPVSGETFTKDDIIFGVPEIQNSPEKKFNGAKPVENFEDLLKICGHAGWWQLRLVLAVSFCGALTALNNLVYAFIGAAPDHWCKLPPIQGLSSEEVKALLIPVDSSGQYEQCSQYYLPWDNNGIPWTNETLPPIDKSQTVPCSSMEFDNETFQSTIVTEFDLTCGSQALASTVQSIFMIGILVGSPIFGSLSDKIGRKKTIAIASVIFILAGPLVAIAPTLNTLMLARFILGASSPGVYGTSFVLAVESVGTSWRGLVGNLFCLPFAFGYMALPVFAYFFRDWRNLQLALAVPTLFQLLACWIAPESPRWLIRKRRLVEAEVILRNAARVNGRSNHLPKDFSNLIQNVSGTEKEEPPSNETWMEKVKVILKGYTQLFQTRKLRTRTLVIYVCWFSCSMIYYGVALNSPNLSANLYVYTFLSGVLEIPSYLMVPPLIKFLGRKKVFSAFFLLCGSSLLASLLFGQGTPMIVALALLGKLLIGAAYSLIYLYATELMPTLIRTFGVGSASMVGRIGSASAPYIVDILGSDKKALPTLLFGTLSLISGFVSLLLPETRNQRLPETVEDVEGGTFKTAIRASISSKQNSQHDSNS